MGNFLKNHDSPLNYVLIEPAPESHIKIKNPAICRECENKPCTYYCPTRVFSWEDALLIDYRRCIECGACPYGCPSENIAWQYPAGGYGVKYGRLPC